MAAKKKTDNNTASETASLHLVFGDDEFLVNAKARELIDGLCPPEERALGLEVVDASAENADEAVQAVGRCLEAVRTSGFFGGNKVVWLRDANFFTDTKTGKAEAVKASVEALTSLIKAGFPAGHVLVVSAPGVDGRKAFFKACKAAGTIHEFKTPDRPAQADQSARERAAEIWRRLGLTPASRDVMEQFMLRVGGDTRRLLAESEKLSAYLGRERRQATVDDVSAIVSPGRESIAWDLADHVGARRTVAALRVMRQLLFQKESSIGLMVGLQNRFREMVLLKECVRRRWVRLEGSDRFKNAVWDVDAEGESLLKGFARDPRDTHPFRVMKLLEQAGGYTLRELIEGQRELAQVHEQMISSAIPHDLLLELLVIRLTGRTNEDAKTSGKGGT